MIKKITLSVMIISIMALSIIFLIIKQKEDKIIYIVDDNLTKEILSIYQKSKNQKESYIEFFIDDCYYDGNRSIMLSNCDEGCKLKNIIAKSNRFLKLNEDIYLPVIFPPDYLFEKETKQQLTKSLGHGKSTIFEIDGRNTLIRIR